MACDSRFDVINTFCESDDQSLKNRTLKNKNSDWLQINHAYSRDQSELDFFKDYLDTAVDQSNPIFLEKGAINDLTFVEQIENQNADLIICYGASLIKPRLIEAYHGRFLNVHLGISPYYKGSGTNIFPIIDKRLGFVGATFMYIDPGIDTGEIIHQIQADFFLGDSVHSVGNRLIKKMTETYADIVDKFEKLEPQKQPTIEGETYFMRDFDDHICRILYDRYQSDLIVEYLKGRESSKHEIALVKNPALTSL